MSTFGLSASPEEAKGTLLDTADRQAEMFLTVIRLARPSS